MEKEKKTTQIVLDPILKTFLTLLPADAVLGVLAISTSFLFQLIFINQFQ